MKRTITLLSFLLCAISGTWAQEANAPLADSTVTVTDSTPPKSTFTIGTSFANNANYYGQRAEEKTPYIALLASWNHKSGFYLTTVAYRLLNDSSRLASAYNFGAGYEFKLSKTFSLDLGYNYTLYPDLSPFLQAANPHMANLTLTHEKWMKSSLTLDYAFGKTNDFFTTAGASKQFDLFSIGKNDIVTFTPLIEITAGTQHFYEYYGKEKNLRDSILGKIKSLLPGRGNGNGNGNGGGNGNNNGNGNGTTIIEKNITSFDLLSYNLKLPVAYNRSHMMFEVSCQFSLLGDKVAYRPGELNTFIGASFYYQF